MSTRTILIGVLALVIGLAAAFGVLKYRQGFAAGPSEETVTVVVAAADIPRGSLATRDVFTTKEYPKSVAPKGAVASVDDAANRVPKDNLIKDEPVMEARLSPKGVGPGFSHVVPPGMRAISIKTPSAATIGGGFILPGNKVDVLFTQRSQNQLNDTTGGGSATLLVQMVEVLAINQRSDPSADSKLDVRDLQTATLLVTPEQMMKIELAQNLGTLTLVLRNGNDKEASVVGPYLGKDIRYSVGRPFSEQVKDVSDTVSKAWEQMQAELRKTAKETADREKDAMAKAAKEEAERMRVMKEENDRLKAELEKERVRLEKLAQAQPKPVAQEPTLPLKVRTLRNNIPGSVDVPANDSNR